MREELSEELSQALSKIDRPGSFCVSGSAPATRETLKFLRAALACDVIEGIFPLERYLTLQDTA